MATAVYDTLEISLENGDQLTVKPLSIKHLRKFMSVVEKLSNENTDENTAMDIFIEAAVVCLQGLDPKKYSDMSNDDVEELLTVPTMLKILEVAGGLKSADPNLLGAALAGMN